MAREWLIRNSKEWLTWNLKVEREEEEILRKILVGIKMLGIHMYNMKHFSVSAQAASGLSFKELVVKEQVLIDNIGANVAALKSLIKQLRASQ